MSNSRDYLLDTNMLGHIAAANAGSTLPEDLRVAQRLELIRQSVGRKIFICAVTVGEVEYGLQVAPTVDHARQTNVRKVLYSFDQSTVLNVDQNVAKASYANLRAALFQKFADKDAKGRAKKRYVGDWRNPATQKELGIQENDLWIASVAMTYNLTLVTADKMTNIKQAASGLPLHMENWLVP
ncbi:MAG: type II toxin-antitoxin system VapC family toxin [Polaromonas sp.]|nr:type II toxin-antitoxin system VapC family toxin [Polaromonas sp.]MDP3752605.1 type II toxin-antitoxin system VapC family toxin [Polaromonas sp.]